MNQSLVIYNCEACMFITRNKKDYTRHLNSRKHIENHPNDDVKDHAVPCGSVTAPVR